ncbi:MAG: SURF1 family cytochrome oxidase biogenesis protein, partial [Alphaproteobacteria bacterium]
RRFTAKGRFVPENDPASNAWFHIDRDRMMRAAGLDRVAPLYLAAAPGEDASPLPIGTSPGTDIRNSHLGYAITWFGLAAALAGVYVAFHMRRRP